MNRLYRENIAEDESYTLRPLFARYAERQPGEHFGDFLVRAGVVLAATGGPDFHGQ